jgi:hypothetical protein
MGPTSHLRSSSSILVGDPIFCDVGFLRPSREFLRKSCRSTSCYSVLIRHYTIYNFDSNIRMELGPVSFPHLEAGDLQNKRNIGT